MTSYPAFAITYAHQSTGDLHDDELSRVTRVKDGSVTVGWYQYNGMSDVMRTTYSEASVFWKHTGATAGVMNDRDRFDRITRSEWIKDLATDVRFYETEISYDRNSNIILVEDQRHSGFDVDYTIDDLDRLTDAQQGTWNGSSITSETRQQTWTLDQVGNWDHAWLDLDGDGNYGGAEEYDDDRTHNDVNELTARDIDDDGTDDYTLDHDKNGNIIDASDR